MKIVAFVPIKLNNMRLPNKNILPLAGKPTCWHIVNTLRSVKLIDEVYVYCSEDKIKDYLPSETVVRIRDKKLDGDTVKGLEIYESFVKEIDADIYVLAHATSPFIKKQTIENSLRKILEGSYDSAFTAERIKTFAWYKNKPLNYDLKDIPRTQDIEPVFVETSGFYIFKRDVIRRHKRRIGEKPYIQEVSGKEAIDIDEEKDYNLALAFTTIGREEINE